MPNDNINDEIRTNSKQNSYRTKKEIVEDLSKQSFAQEIENDKVKAAQYINRGKQADEQRNIIGSAIADQEIRAVAVYKRALLLVGSGNLQLHSDRGTEVYSGSENGLPVSSYLSHGARVMIEIPPGSGDKLANWLTSGKANESGISRKQTQQAAIDDGKIVYNRPAATHGVSIEKAKDFEEYTVKEKKGFSIGLKDFLSNKIFGKETNHFGVDLALNAALGENDSQGNDVLKPDGDHGHIYIHYIPPTSDKPGSMLIGIEGGSPTSAKHSKTGAAEVLSPIDGSKWDNLNIKKEIAGESEYEQTIMPKKYEGMTIKLRTDQLEQITKLDVKTFSEELAYAKPGKSVEDFKSKIANSNKIPPQFKASRSLEFSKEKPTLLKKIANVVIKVATASLIKPFETEIKDYKVAKKKFDAQMNVVDEDIKRLRTQRIDKMQQGIMGGKIYEQTPTQGRYTVSTPNVTPRVNNNARIKIGAHR